MKTINDRYLILKTLSKDSSMVEYLVEDEYKNGQIKRLRIFDTEMSNYDFIKRMENQFVEVSTLYHENLLTAYEFQPIDLINNSNVNRKQFFYTYEHYDEEQIVHYTDLNKSEVNSVLIQLCKVMRYLHYRGFIYKYLNFNTLVLLRVNNKIVLKLIDMAHHFIDDYYFKLDHERYNHFIAPEVLWGEEIDNTADIYSLGTLFYYLYYRVDYKISSIDNIAKSGQVTDIHRFIQKSTSHIKDERHQTIELFIDELSHLVWIDVDQDDIKYYDRLQDQTTIIGREGVLKEIRMIFDEKVKKNTYINGIYIQGEYGSGKTRLMQEIKYICRFNRFLTAIIDTHSEIDSKIPSIFQIIKFIADQEDVSPILIQKYGVELISAVPELKSKWNLKETESLVLEDNHLRILNRAYNFFLEYVSNHFLVILIDDEENIKTEERYFFDLLMNQKNVTNYCIIFSGSGEESPYVSLGAQSKVLKLSTLNLEETGLLVKSILGMDHIPFKFTHRLMVESQGKPSVTKMMIKRLWQENVIFFDEEKLKWDLDLVDDSYEFDFELDGNNNIKATLDTLTAHQVEIFKTLSVLQSSFNMKILLDFTGIPEEEAYMFIYEMEEHKFISKKISDVEYVFSFSSNDLRKQFYDLLDESTIFDLSKKAAKLYEERFEKTNEINEDLIDYLLACHDYFKAADYAVLFSDLYFNMTNAHKALDLLEMALDIYIQLNDENKILVTAKRLANNLFTSGYMDRALEILDEMKRYGNQSDYIDFELIRAMYFYYKNDVTSAIEIIDEAYEMAIDIQYLKGELEAMKIKARCLRNVGRLEEHKAISDVYLKKSYEEEVMIYQANFENEVGINLLYNNYYDKCLEHFEKSLEFYTILKDHNNIVGLYNNFGVIYSDGYGDFLRARDFYKKAYNLAMKYNYYVSIPIYLNNIGETYQIEGNYPTASKYFDDSYHQSENVGDKNILVLSLLNMCQTALWAEDYAKTHTLINRLEHEISFIQRRSHDQFDYYLLHFDYFLSMNAVMKVDKWRYDFNADTITDDYRKFRMKMIDLKLQYKKSVIIFNKKRVPVRELWEMYHQTQNAIQAKLLRTFISGLMIELIDDHDYATLEQLIEIDNLLIDIYNTSFISNRRWFIDMCLTNHLLENESEIIECFKDNSNEMLWRVYKILGDEHYYRKDLYNSLRSYLLALDIISDLTNQIIIEYKETYVLYDDVKMALKTRINKIVHSFIWKQSKENTKLYDNRIDTIEDFFDLTDFRRLFETGHFMKFIYNQLDNQVFNPIQKTSELIKNLGKDEMYNIEMIVSFIRRITFAERAQIYLLDENDSVTELIGNNNGKEHYDIMRLVNSVGSDSDGIYINKLDPLTNTQLLQHEQKAVVFFPIYEADIDSEVHNKRREDLLVAKKKNVGYVFVDTDNVINRINQLTFEQSKAYMNLIYLMINNYHLKRISTIDKLTGVYLRKHIEQEFAIELNRSRLNNYQLSVIMLDIDKFKSVNDTYGHRKGDEILMRIGELIKKSVRSTDYVGRYGGEEFIIILPETSSKDGYLVAEKIRSIVDLSKLLGEEMPLTVSLGVSTFPEDGANEDELIEKSDQALYYSKNNGRNQSNCWDEKLVKEGKRYDKLTGILTGNISSDTRNIQAFIEILKELDRTNDRESQMLNTFITLIDITEADEVNFVSFDDSYDVKECYHKQKGQDLIENSTTLDERLINKYKGREISEYFIDWEEIVTYDEMSNIPNWRSYIVLAFNEPQVRGILAISVKIRNKEFDFSNFNYVNSLKSVIKHILFYS